MSVNQSDNIRILRAFRGSHFFDKVALLLSLWFGMGLLPGIPGTFGTVGAIPLFLLIVSLSRGYQALFLLIIIAGAVWSSQRSLCILGNSDPREIVIDEVAGFLLTMVFLPFTWLTLIAGFFFFRFFDILKLPPIKKIEREIRGSLGVVLDDLLAGVYAHLCLRLLLFIVNR